MFTKNNFQEINKLRSTLEAPAQPIDFIREALDDFDKIHQQSDEKQEAALKAWLVNYYQRAPEAAKQYFAPFAHAIAYQLALAEVDSGQFDDFIVPRAVRLLFSKADNVAILAGEITDKQFLTQDYLQLGSSTNPIIIPWPHLPHKKKEPSLLMLRSLASQDILNSISIIEQLYANQASGSNVNIAKNQTEKSAQELLTALKKMIAQHEVCESKIKALIQSLSYRYSKTGFTGEPHSPTNVLCAQLAWLCVDKKSENPQKDFWAILYPEITQVYDGEGNTNYPVYGQAVIDNTVTATQSFKLIHYGKIHALAQQKEGFDKVKKELSNNAFKQVTSFYPGHREFWGTANCPVIQYPDYAAFFKALLEYLQSYVVGKGGSTEYEISAAAMDTLEKDYAPYLRYFIRYLDSLSEAQRSRFEKATTVSDKVKSLGEIRIIAIARVLLNPPPSHQTASCFHVNQQKLAFLLGTKAAGILEININPSLFIEGALPESGNQVLSYVHEVDLSDKKLDRESMLDIINQDENPNFAIYAQNYGLTRNESHKAKNLFNFIWQIKEVENKISFMKALLGEELDFSLLIYHDQEEYLVFAEKLRELDNHIPEDIIQKGIKKGIASGVLPFSPTQLRTMQLEGVPHTEIIAILTALSNEKYTDKNKFDFFHFLTVGECLKKEEEEFSLLLDYYLPCLNDIIKTIDKYGYDARYPSSIITRNIFTLDRFKSFCLARLGRRLSCMLYANTDISLTCDDFLKILECEPIYHPHLKKLIQTKTINSPPFYLTDFQAAFNFILSNNQSTDDFNQAIMFFRGTLALIANEDIDVFYGLIEQDSLFDINQRTLIIQAIIPELIVHKFITPFVSVAKRYPSLVSYNSEVIKFISTHEDFTTLENLFPTHKAAIKSDFIQHKQIIPLYYFDKFKDLIYALPSFTVSEVGEQALPSSESFTLDAFLIIAKTLNKNEFQKFAEYYALDLKRILTKQTLKVFLESLTCEQRAQVFPLLNYKLKHLFTETNDIVLIAPLFENIETLPNNEQNYFDLLYDTLDSRSLSTAAQILIDSYRAIGNVTAFNNFLEDDVRLFEPLFFYVGKDYLNRLSKTIVMHFITILPEHKLPAFCTHGKLLIQKLSEEDILSLLTHEVNDSRASILAPFFRLSLGKIFVFCMANQALAHRFKKMLNHYSVKELVSQLRLNLPEGCSFEDLRRIAGRAENFARNLFQALEILLKETVKILLLLVSETPFGNTRYAQTLQTLHIDSDGNFDFEIRHDKNYCLLHVLASIKDDSLSSLAWKLACIPDNNERIRQTYQAAYDQNPFAYSTRGATSALLRFSNPPVVLNLTDTPEPGSRLANVLEALRGPSNL